MHPAGCLGAAMGLLTQRISGSAGTLNSKYQGNGLNVFSSGVGLVDRSSSKTQRSGYYKVGTKQPSANGLNFLLRPVRTGCLVPTSKTVMLCECLLYSTCAGSAVAPRAPARASAAPRASLIARSRILCCITAVTRTPKTVLARSTG